jgi:hypothetical protein
MAKKYSVVVGADFVLINRNGKEVLYWDRREWQEDPEVVFAIVKAVNLSLTNPARMDAVLKEMKR